MKKKDLLTISILFLILISCFFSGCGDDDLVTIPTATPTNGQNPTQVPTATPTQPGGSSWEVLENADPPSPRAGHSMINVLGNVYVFGGTNDTSSLQSLAGPVFNDLARFNADNGVFEKVNPANDPPSPRSGVALGSVDNSLYSFGGENENQKFNELWKYNVEQNTWELVNTSGSITNPQADFSEQPQPTATVLPAGGGDLIMNVGAGSGVVEAVGISMDYLGKMNNSQTYQIDIDRDLTGGTNGQIEVFLPNPFDGITNSIVFEIYNGSGELLDKKTIPSTPSGNTELAKLTDLNDYTGERMFKVYLNPPDGEKPEPRCYPGNAVSGKFLFITGGDDGTGLLSDTWLLDLTDYTWTKGPDFPGDPSIPYASVTGVINDQIILCGTSGDKLFTYNTVSNTWDGSYVSGLNPEARAHAAYAQDGDLLYMCGGLIENTPVDDAWKLDLSSNTWTQLEDMPFSLGGGAASMLTTGESLFFAGADIDLSPTDDVFIYMDK